MYKLSLVLAFVLAGCRVFTTDPQGDTRNVSPSSPIIVAAWNDAAICAAPLAPTASLASWTYETMDDGTFAAVTTTQKDFLVGPFAVINSRIIVSESYAGDTLTWTHAIELAAYSAVVIFPDSSCK